MKEKDKTMKKDYFEYIVYTATIFYLLDIIVLGSGTLTKIGGFSTRMLFFMIALVGTIPNIITNVKKYLSNKYCIVIGLFFIYLIIATVMGIVNGNKISFLINDIRGFLNLWIVIPMIYVFNTKKRVLFVMKLLLYVLTGMAFITLLLSLYPLFSNEMQGVIYSFLNDYSLAIINYLYGDVMRVFLHTASRIMFLGFMYALTLVHYQSEKKVLWEVCATVLLTSLFVTYTRSLYLGIFICFLFFIVTVATCYKEYAKQYVYSLVRIALYTLVLILILGLLQRENPLKVAVGRCLLAGTSWELLEDMNIPQMDILDNMEAEIDSLSIRDARKQMVLKNIKKSPIFGNGLGVVNDENEEPIEYFYLDMLSKVGIVGMVLFLAPFILAAIDILKNRMKYFIEQRFYTYSCLVGVLLLLVISYFNPCMNTSVGLAIYGLLISSVAVWKQYSIEENIHEEEKS